MSDESLTAGRELDARVAEKVFGLVPCANPVHLEGHYAYLPGPCHAQPDSPSKGGETRCYSTDFSAAWEVVEAMRARGLKFDLNDRNGEPGKEYWAEFAAEDYDTGAQAWEASMPLAICKAALAAIESTTT